MTSRWEVAKTAQLRCGQDCERRSRLKIQRYQVEQAYWGCTQRAATVDEETIRTKSEMFRIITTSFVEGTPKHIANHIRYSKVLKATLVVDNDSLRTYTASIQFHSLDHLFSLITDTDARSATAQENDSRHIVTPSHNVSSWWRDVVYAGSVVIRCARGAQSVIARFVACGGGQLAGSPEL